MLKPLELEFLFLSQLDLFLGCVVPVLDFLTPPFLIVNLMGSVTFICLMKSWYSVTLWSKSLQSIASDRMRDLTV